MSFIFGGGGGGAATPTESGSQMVTQREAPEVEARKLSLYDQAAKLAATPVSLPSIQVAPATALEQQAFQQAGQIGVGAPTVAGGISAIQASQQGPQISQFFNPYQQYVTQEINRQAALGQQNLAAQAIGAGAFGGGRQGVAQGELERARLSQIGLAQQTGFNTALQAAAQQQQLGLQAGQLLGALGGQQQAMRVQDLNTLMGDWWSTKTNWPSRIRSCKTKSVASSIRTLSKNRILKRYYDKFTNNSKYDYSIHGSRN